MPVKVKEVTIAHSPDSDDAFMFYALAKNKLDTKGLVIKQVLKDIQSLNQDAIKGRYEVSAISFAVYPQVAAKYALMPCGASIGDGYGPILVARKDLDIDNLAAKTIAIPGLETTAYLALRLWRPDLQVAIMPFDQILTAVSSAKVDAGLIIHEGQLTYENLGLQKVVDLGEWWAQLTGLPLPLGGNVVRKDLGPDLMRELTCILSQSIKYSLAHRQDALSYAMDFARDMREDLADKFVGMYVNELTVDYGERGRKALIKLFEMAYEKSIYKEPVKLEFVEI